MFAFVAFTSLILSTPSFAAACYSANEFEAEQGLRIHSELMVIGLTCVKMQGGMEMYDKYQQFTQKNQKLLSSYEEEIIDFYRRQGEPEPEAKFHTLRTTLANTISRQAIKMSPSSFCAQFGPRVGKALEMDQKKLRHWAQHVWPNTPTSEPVCTGKG
jgi:hypothetical protein